MQARIDGHKQRRQQENWLCIEEPIQIVDKLQELAQPNRCILFDCLSLWLSNLLFKRAEVDLDYITEHTTQLIDCLPTLPGQVIMSNMVGLE